MIFAEPVTFNQALQSHEVRSIILTNMTADEMRKISGDILRRALFSARVSNAEYLQKVRDVLARILRGELDQATARLELKKYLSDLGYEPLPPEKGTIMDWSSDRRINLMLDTQTEIVRGFGQWARGQDPVILDQWPAQELYRAYQRKKTRDETPLPWKLRWKMAGGTVRDDGRMIALVNDAVWDNLGNKRLFKDGLGNPFAPFAYGSGMFTRRINRKKSMELGLIDRDTQIPPRQITLNDNLELPVDVRDADLRAVLEADGYQFRRAADGTEVLTL